MFVLESQLWKDRIRCGNGRHGMILEPRGLGKESREVERAVKKVCLGICRSKVVGCIGMCE